jgi:hypothetical protein
MKVVVIPPLFVIVLWCALSWMLPAVAGSTDDSNNQGQQQQKDQYQGSMMSLSLR